MRAHTYARSYWESAKILALAGIGTLALNRRTEMRTTLEKIGKDLPARQITKTEDEVKLAIVQATQKVYREGLAEVARTEVDVDVAFEVFASLWNNIKPRSRRDIANAIDALRVRTEEVPQG